MTRKGMMELERIIRENEALVGETVKIKTVEELRREYGEENMMGEIDIPGALTMLPDMIKQLCGKYVKITEVENDAYFMTDSYWYICREMIDESSLPADITESDELNSFLSEFLK